MFIFYLFVILEYNKMPRPQLPPSDDPKVQARRDKARENAQKKRDGDKNVKAGSTIAAFFII
jgi:hypothetical protein